MHRYIGGDILLITKKHVLNMIIGIQMSTIKMYQFNSAVDKDLTDEIFTPDNNK